MSKVLGQCLVHSRNSGKAGCSQLTEINKPGNKSRQLGLPLEDKFIHFPKSVFCTLQYVHEVNLCTRLQ